MSIKIYFFAHLFLFLFVSTTIIGQTQNKALGNQESLKPGQVLYSASGIFKMQFQNNKLVIKKKNAIIWQSKNWGLWNRDIKIDKVSFVNGEIQCYFQNKLNWSSMTNFPDSKLILGDDGIL